jgi:hypothetical protein
MEALGTYLVRIFIHDELVRSATPSAPVRPDTPRRRTLRQRWRR